MVEKGFFLKKFIFGSITRKLFLGLFELAFLVILVSAVSLFFRQVDFENHLVEQVEEAQNDFLTLETGDTIMLSAALETFLQNESFKEIYLEKDREKLFLFGQPLFQELKEKYGITHFYFILPDGRNFVRLHNKDIFGDQITRITLQKVMETGKEASGLELGKTAFALRVVKPYYDEGQLIGYVEFGQEIGYFLHALKENSNSQFYIIVEKKYFNHEDWSSVRESAGLQDNWDDLQAHLILSTTLLSSEPLESCFVSENVAAAEKKASIFKQVSKGGKSFACGGFPITDAGGNKVGVVFSLIDITETVNFHQLVTGAFFVLVIITILMVFLIGFFFSRTISLPIKKLYVASKKMEAGNFTGRVAIKTGDELEELGLIFNKATMSLEKMDAEHKQLEHAKTEFLSITSHELRSPMTPMKAQLQMLKEGFFGKLNPKQVESVDIVLRNTTRLDKIVVDFLEISRIEAARLKFRFVKISLDEPVKLLIEEMKGFMPEKKIEIVARIEPLPVIEIDPDRVMQVLRNLLNNAKKFSPENSKITVTIQSKTKEILFSVKDQGIGVSKENQRKIFEPFFQEEQTMYRKYGGTGLGLTICKGIIESQNGKIWLESQKDKGTTFFFTVPFKPVKEIKPIKLLFSPQESVEKKLVAIFTDVLGPMGKQEFALLQANGVGYKSTIAYFQVLFKSKIIDDAILRNTDKQLKQIFNIEI